jgi:hypothetical protein
MKKKEVKNENKLVLKKVTVLELDQLRTINGGIAYNKVVKPTNKTEFNFI